ncbi:uncharacterized protein [Onthophagus taurus]|uniref:uncharacterized protein n=1 Tax=Onthophagus taurus TaxID=166361 RepID=UPI0039BE2F18
MRYLLVLLGLIATSWATQPATQTCQNKISACLNAAATVSLPDINIQANINLLGLVVIGVSVELDCTTIAVLVNAGTEISYNETTSGGVVTAVISIGVAVDIDLNLNAVVVVKLLGLIQIGLGVCVITYVDVDITINVSVTFAVGDASNCKIKQIAPVCSKSNCSISNSGNSNVDTATGNSKNEICNQSFSGMQNSLQNVLNNAIEA